jgi:hypothetical protein
MERDELSVDSDDLARVYRSRDDIRIGPEDVRDTRWQAGSLLLPRLGAVSCERRPIF